MVQLQTPVALFLFNRPELTARVFAAIRQARPARLLLVADGPRPDRPGEAERCAAARAAVAQVDWPCQVATAFAETNLGCRARLASGISWVFDTVPEAIILEDDCLPHPDFFPFCAELLERYRGDERVMHIGGANFQGGRRHGAASYYFSRYAHVWGWASWRRAWRHYDLQMAGWPAAGRQILRSYEHPGERRYWRHAWDEAAGGRIDTWDYQWVYACAARGGLAVIPNVNLVSNLGFGVDATHTLAASRLANLPVEGLQWPLRHPAVVERCGAADAIMREVAYQRDGLVRRAGRRALRLFQ